MRISDWSSDVCSSDLSWVGPPLAIAADRPRIALRQANEALTEKNHELLQLNRDNGQWLERHGRLERQLAQARQNTEDHLRELDALRLTAAEHEALQRRWAEDARTLEALRTELASVRTEVAQERQRRESADSEALRAGVRLETLEQLLAQLRPVSTADTPPAAAPDS